MQGARVVALGLAREGGAPIEPVEELRLQPGLGVVGDRYALGSGTWQEWPDRDVTLVEAEVAEALAIAPLLLRRNVVVRNARLEALVGRTFRLGEATLEGVRPCDPCQYLERHLGRPGLKSALEGRGGLRARIVAGGSVRVGDPLDA